MKKIVSVGCILLAFVCVFGLFVPNLNAADVAQHKKIVSVVYDDSGSMLGENRFVYANYAMQTFCSMLGAEDELYITYMNQKRDSITVDLSDGSIQASVDTIRSLSTPSGVTPFESVTKAMDVLRGKKETNERTEMILVVITDGVFTGYEFDAEPVRQEFSDFADERMYNGTKPQVIYLGIGNNVTELNLNMSNVKEFYADESSPKKEDRIVAKMSEIANLVSGRSEIASTEIRSVDEKTLEIQSAVPLSNIAALVQGSAGKIVSVTHKESGKKLNVGRNVSSYCTENSSLSSQSFLITAGKENISEGTYVLTFDQAVSAENVVLMVEPALEIRLSIECNGREIDKLTELDGLREKDLISVNYKIYEYGTDKEVLLSELPQGTKASLTVYENGTEKQKVNGAQNTVHHYELSRLKTEFKAVLELPNFNSIEAVISFTPLKYIHYTVQAEFGGAAQSVKRNEIAGQHDLSLVFTLFADGAPVTDPAVVNGFAPKVTLSPDGNAGTTTVRADGKIVFVPNAAPSQGYVGGSMTVTATCTVNGVSASANYTVKEPIYEIKAEFGSATESLKLTEITKPHDLSIVFTVWEDGVQITDKAKLEALGYSVSVSPEGTHAGRTGLTNDGKIIFTPHTANGAGTATVTCKVGNMEKTKTYEVIDPTYEIKAEFGSATESLKLTEITKPHDLSIIFTVWEDGVQITDKAKIEALVYSVSVSPEGTHAGKTELTDDGKIIFTPHTAQAGGTVTVSCTVAGVRKTKTYEIFAPVYEIKAEFGSDVREIHLDNIEKDHGLSIVFTVWEDGKQITEKAMLETLAPTFAYSEDGAEGKHVITDDGKIIFTPNKAYGKTGGGFYDVIVTCAVGGATASKTYRVLLPNIVICPIEPETAIPKHEFFGNTVSVSFYIMKDGKRLTKAEIEVLAPQILNEKYAGNLEISYEFAEDGTVTCTPFAPTEHKVNFFGWFVNWWWYWTQPGENVNILFESNFGSAEGIVSVCPAPLKYQITMVWLPFLLLLAIVLFLIWWIFCIVTKPRFPKNRTIYAGKVYLAFDGSDTYYHTIFGFKKYPMKKYNTLKYILKPTRTPLEKTIMGIRFEAAKKGPKCYASFCNVDVSDLGTSASLDAIQIFAKKGSLNVEEMIDDENAAMKGQVLISPGKDRGYMVTKAKSLDKNGYEHVAKGVILFYV